jgi:hypothetical protein
VTVLGHTETAGPGPGPGPDDATVSEMIEAVGATPILAGPGCSVENRAFLEEHDVFVNESFQRSYLPLPSLAAPAERLPSAAGRRSKPPRRDHSSCMPLILAIEATPWSGRP